ncbi:MAG: hypothetical protein GY842_07315, partial [bacterium]|nr:hypothetical protein [bacterium]
FVLESGVYIYGGFAGTETDRDQRDPATNETILSGNIGNDAQYTNNSYHVVVGGDGTTLDGFTVTEGFASGEGDHSRGAGMFNDGVDVTIDNCQFVNNATGDGPNGTSGLPDVPPTAGGDGGHGGAIYNRSSTLLISNTVFQDNTTGRGGTGGSNDLGYSYDSGNGGHGGDGAGICSENTTLELIDCQFIGNTAGNGGSGGSGGDLGSVTGNPGAGGNGGNGAAIYATVSPLTLTRVTIKESQSGKGGNCPESPEDGEGCPGGRGGDGGGLFIQGSAATLENCTISDNSAGAGGNATGSTG